MGGSERVKKISDKKIFELFIIEGHVTREKIEEMKDKPFRDGLTVGEFVESNIDNRRFKWNEEDCLVPDFNEAEIIYSDEDKAVLERMLQNAEENPGVILQSFVRVGLGVSDNDDLQEALRRKSLATGEMPDVILTKILNNGLGIVGKDNS